MMRSAKDCNKQRELVWGNREQRCGAERCGGGDFQKDALNRIEWRRLWFARRRRRVGEGFKAWAAREVGEANCLRRREERLPFPVAAEMKFMKLGSKPDVFRSDGSCIRFDLFPSPRSSSPSKSLLAVDFAIFCFKFLPSCFGRAEDSFSPLIAACSMSDLILAVRSTSTCPLTLTIATSFLNNFFLLLLISNSCRFVVSELPTDVVIHVEEVRFFLHKVRCFA